MRWCSVLYRKREGGLIQYFTASLSCVQTEQPHKPHIAATVHDIEQHNRSRLQKIHQLVYIILLQIVVPFLYNHSSLLGMASSSY